MLQRAALAGAGGQCMQLSEKGLCPAMQRGASDVVKTGPYYPLQTEEDVFRMLNLRYREPSERRNKKDVISAVTGKEWFQPGAGCGAMYGEVPIERERVLALPQPSTGLLQFR